MADELRKAFGVEAAIVPGSTGAFEVLVDGKTVFSKLQEDRFPESGEILRLLNGKP